MQIDVMQTEQYIEKVRRRNIHYNVHPRHMALILAYYNGDSRMIDELEQLTKLPRWMVRNIASRLGYRAGRERRMWTQEERDFLLDQYGRIPVANIARRLQRSVASVVLKAHHLHLNQLDNQGWFSLTELATILKIDRETIRRDWIRRGLTFRRIRKDRAYLFSHKDIRTFFESIPEIYNWPALSEIKKVLLGLKKENRYLLPLPPLEKQVRCRYYLRGEGRECGYTKWMELYAGQNICPHCGRKMSTFAVAYRGDRNAKQPEYERSNASIGYYFDVMN